MQWITRRSQNVRTRGRESIPYRSFSSCGLCRWCSEWVMRLCWRLLLRHSNQIKLIKFFSSFFSLQPQLARRTLQTTKRRAAFMDWTVRIYQSAWKKIARKIWEINSSCKSEWNCRLRKVSMRWSFVSWETFFWFRLNRSPCHQSTVDSAAWEVSLDPCCMPNDSINYLSRVRSQPQKPNPDFGPRNDLTAKPREKKS